MDWKSTCNKIFNSNNQEVNYWLKYKKIKNLTQILLDLIIMKFFKNDLFV